MASRYHHHHHHHHLYHDDDHDDDPYDADEDDAGGYLPCWIHSPQPLLVTLSSLSLLDTAGFYFPLLLEKQSSARVHQGVGTN